MAVCAYCDQEMLIRIGCTVVRYEGENLDRLAVESPEFCESCMAPEDSMHHPGCDRERCPCCKGQAIGCQCYED